MVRLLRFPDTEESGIPAPAITLRPDDVGLIKPHYQDN